MVFKVKLKDGSIVNVRFRLECGYQPIDVPNWTPPDKPDPEPTPTPPEPKDPNNDPQNRDNADDYDFYSPDHQNHDPDTTVTDEPTSPDSYTPPSRPDDTVVPPSNDDDDQHSATEDNGTTETHDGQDYDVEAGDGQDHSDLSDVADPSNPNKPDVDPALQGDGANQNPVTDFE